MIPRVFEEFLADFPAECLSNLVSVVIQSNASFVVDDEVPEMVEVAEVPVKNGKSKPGKKKGKKKGKKAKKSKKAQKMEVED